MSKLGIRSFSLLMFFVVLFCAQGLDATCTKGHPACPDGDCRLQSRTEQEETILAFAAQNTSGNNQRSIAIALAFNDRLAKQTILESFDEFKQERISVLDFKKLKQLAFDPNTKQEYSTAIRRYLDAHEMYKSACSGQLAGDTWYDPGISTAANYFGMAPTAVKTVGGVGVSLATLLLLKLFTQLAKNPMDTLTSAAYNPFSWLLKNHKAEEIGNLAEDIRSLAFEIKDYIQKSKQNLAGLDKAANMRQAGFDTGGIPPAQSLELAQASGSPVSLLIGKAHGVDSCLNEINDLVADFAKNPRQAKKFSRQVKLLKGLKSQLTRTAELIKKVVVPEDLVDSKRGGALQLNAADLEGDANVLAKSLIVFGVTAKPSAGAPRNGLYSGSLGQ